MVSFNDYLYFLWLMILVIDMCYIEINDGMFLNVIVIIVWLGFLDYYFI